MAEDELPKRDPGPDEENGESDEGKSYEDHEEFSRRKATKGDFEDSIQKDNPFAGADDRAELVEEDPGVVPDTGNGESEPNDNGGNNN